MDKYWHSVVLDNDYCNGCTNCLSRCPTQAIRVIDGKAKIMKERCIDCGECLKICHFHAKGTLSDNLEKIHNYKYKVALPNISMYGQFSAEYDIEDIFQAIYKLGFDLVYDVAYAADILTKYQNELLREPTVEKPVISTYCPAITRLIQIRYPSLIENITRLESPMEIAARQVKKKIMQEQNLEFEEIGVFLIAQCPAKITSIMQPLGLERSYIDGGISLESIYARLIKAIDKDSRDHDLVQRASGNGVGWGMVGGQSFGLDTEKYLAVDGIEEVIRVLDKMELGKLPEIDFFEGYACVTGCSGGVLNVENPFMAKARIRMKSSTLRPYDPNEIDSNLTREDLEWDVEMEPRTILKLDKDFKISLKKMAKLEEIAQKLPGIDCGACGAPTCRALAEDIVMNRAKYADCLLLGKYNRRRQKKTQGDNNED
ncbi:MAG: 4Fe-4S dicluster domain-containing protein [Clostridiales bacterium]|nr:4Fe-4S dicluster domain-containing protein [Clostridiales bacterium]